MIVGIRNLLTIYHILGLRREINLHELGEEVRLPWI
jgi:hypothetical protein